MKKVKKQNNSYIYSIICNLVIVVFTMVASFILFSGIKITLGTELVLETGRLGMFQFFTVDSNIFMGIVALLFMIKEMEFLKGKIKEIPKSYYLLKLIATTSVVLTFVIVFIYLGPIFEGGTISMLRNSNIFLHLLMPLLSMITFMFFEKTDVINIKNTFVSIIPMSIYGIFI